MNFCSFIFFLFIVLLSVLLAEKKNNHKKDLYEHDNKNSYRSSHKRITSVKCATREPEYHEWSKNVNVHETFVKYKQGDNKRNLDKGRNDNKYSKNISNNKNSGDIFKSVKSEEACDYKNNMVNKCNVTRSSKPTLKKNSFMNRLKNKLYKMIFKRNKFWRVISGTITVLGQSTIMYMILMVIGSIIICSWPSACTCAFAGTLIVASLVSMGVITLLIILIIVVVWLLVTWLWLHKDIYYETHEK
ncbi:Plasmodium exported protein (hyp15), unknown function [Plasmodium sp. gorilla clade G2]|uniref:Plasmodium exported protein (hyp15), unknown function n=1 Tax=Plasmodium sp. gorilla clade G2 TaxID=880535 RepID=UPI000D2C8704|nr:Plasmodium exported protein (hyp15), unknown function [Plasmodium sp. gorilla clade G2]SOV20284.1 Plasmodium exported protein (hyp15), unknown function [Plasmodium sp. gorilla clade G2]